VITFGPDGITGHEDHIAIGAAVTEAFHAARAAGDDGEFEHLLYLAVAASALEALNEHLRERGLGPIDPTQPFMPRGVPVGSIGVRVDCSAAFDRKLEALRCHKTQSELQDIPFDLWPEILGTETFVQAWPERGPGDPVRGSLFEGLADP